MRGLLILVLVSGVACQQVDQKKFEPLYLVGKQLELLSPAEFGGLQEKLHLELSVARDRATTAAERKMVDLYEDAWIAVLDADYAHRLKMIKREQVLSGTRKHVKEDPAVSAALGMRVWELLTVASRCYNGKGCAEPQGLSKKRSDDIAREYDEKEKGKKKGNK